MPITVYRFEDAPAQLQALSELGGGEFWIAHVSADYEEQFWIPWLQEGHFSNRVQHELLEDGTAVYIGAK